MDYVTLGYIVSIKGGKRLPAGVSLSQIENDHPYIRVRDLNNVRMLEKTEDIEYVDDETQKSIARYIVDKGDIVISIVGTIGLIAIVGDSLHHANLTENCVRLTDISKDYDSLFLYYYLISELCQDEIKKRTVGAVQPKLPLKNIAMIPVPIIDLQTQKRIAGILSSLDDKIEVNNQINRNLEEQAFSFYNNQCNEAKQQCELNSIAVLNPVRPLQKGTVAQSIDMAQLSTTSAYPNPGVYKSYGGGMKFQNGDTLLARITPCLENGKTAYIDFLKDGEVAFGSTEYIVLSSRGKMPSQFFYCLARDKCFRDYATKHMNGSSGRQRVSADALEKYMIPSISEEAMKQFGQNVEPLFKLMRQKADENIRLSSLRDTLLPKLMSGEISFL